MRTGAEDQSSDVVRLYEAGRTQYEVAIMLGLSQGTICQRLRVAGIPARTRWDHYATQPVQEAFRLYRSGLNCGHVSRIVGVTPAAVRARLRKAGVTIRPAKPTPLSGPDNPAWKGGRFKSDGYIWVSIGSKRRAAEHRLVMERSLSRQLTKQEIVHHLNGVRDDNRLDNLVVTTLKNHEHYTFVKALQARIRELESVIQKKSVCVIRERDQPHT